MDFTPLNVTFAIFGISMLVVVHEAGHYFAARAFGMRVLRFSIGLGPAIWRYKPKDSPTTYQVCALPLLAYVQIDGMNPADEIDPKDPGLYPNKGVFARIATIFAGPLANYVAASLMIFVLAQVGGLPDTDTTNRVGGVAKGSPAQLARVRQGDVVVAVAGEPVSNYEDLVAANRERAGQPTEFVVERDGERITLVITPRLQEIDGRSRPVIGIRLVGERVYRTHEMRRAAFLAVERPLAMTIANLIGLGNLIQKALRGEANPDQVRSVVGMTEILSDAIRIAPQEYIAYLILISIALGLFNLLPVPALDGGRLAFLAYEVITRRRANEKVEAAVHTVGLLLLLGLLAVVMVRDVLSLT